MNVRPGGLRAPQLSPHRPSEARSSVAVAKADMAGRQAVGECIVSGLLTSSDYNVPAGARRKMRLSIPVGIRLNASESLSGGSSRIEFSPSGVESGRPAADSGPARNALKSLFFDHHRPLAGATVAERCRATVLSLVEAPWAKSCGEGPVDRSKINRFKYSSIV
jgi:hypothetical protein